MIHILKQSVASATHSWHNTFTQAVIKLTFYYVLSTAVILLVSSVAVLGIFTPPEAETSFQTEPAPQIEIEHADWSVYEVREHLASVIFIVDLLILFVVSIFSYFFARKTLLPIQEMHEKQKRFLGDVAHELRTPLSILQTGADTILRKERTSAEYTDFVTDVQEEAERLTRLSNQLLKLLRTGDVAATTPTNVSVSEIFTDEIRRFTPYAVEHGITLTSDISANITAYIQKDELIEIVQNLLKNAIDYSTSGDSVQLLLHTDTTHITFAVIDTGIGISKEHQKLVFERFTKVDEARTQIKSSGTGLGLSITKMLVTKLGGEIALTSEVGVGTEITVKLPKLHS